MRETGRGKRGEQHASETRLWWCSSCEIVKTAVRTFVFAAAFPTTIVCAAANSECSGLPVQLRTSRSVFGFCRSSVQ